MPGARRFCQAGAAGAWHAVFDMHDIRYNGEAGGTDGEAQDQNLSFTVSRRLVGACHPGLVGVSLFHLSSAAHRLYVATVFPDPVHRGYRFRHSLHCVNYWASAKSRKAAADIVAVNPPGLMGWLMGDVVRLAAMDSTFELDRCVSILLHLRFDRMVHYQSEVATSEQSNRCVRIKNRVCSYKNGDCTVKRTHISLCCVAPLPSLMRGLISQRSV